MNEPASQKHLDHGQHKLNVLSSSRSSHLCAWGGRCSGSSSRGLCLVGLLASVVPGQESTVNVTGINGNAIRSSGRRGSRGDNRSGSGSSGGGRLGLVGLLAGMVARRNGSLDVTGGHSSAVRGGGSSSGSSRSLVGFLAGVVAALNLAFKLHGTSSNAGRRHGSRSDSRCGGGSSCRGRVHDSSLSLVSLLASVVTGLNGQGRDRDGQGKDLEELHLKWRTGGY